MTAKEYLNQARHLDALINCRLREIDYWRDLSRHRYSFWMEANVWDGDTHSSGNGILIPGTGTGAGV